LPDNHIFLNELVAAVSNGSIINLSSISSKSLDLMALITPMDSIRKHIPVMSLIALAPAKWAHLITAKSFGLHFLIEASYQLIIL
jgi:hypothetical protein